MSKSDETYKPTFQSRTPGKRNMKKTKPRHNINKLPKTNDKDKNLKSNQKKKIHTEKQIEGRLHQKQCKPENSGVTFFK